MAIGDLDDTRDARSFLEVGSDALPRLFAVGRVKAMEGIGLNVFRFGEDAVEIEEDCLGTNNRYSAASLPFSAACPQRSAATSSLSRASTQLPPCGPSSRFQNGAFVFNQSIRKWQASKAASR